MPLNFYGHVLAGNAKKLMMPLDADLKTVACSGLPWTGTVLSVMKIDPGLAQWCYYRLQLYFTPDIGSAESALLRTAVWRFIEALYVNWEIVIGYIPESVVEDAIEDLQVMAEISKEYPVMLWEYYDDQPSSEWVARTKSKLPSLESIKEFYELPHMRAMFINMKQSYFCDDNFRDAEKGCRKALADRNRRLNRDAVVALPRFDGQVVSA